MKHKKVSVSKLNHTGRDNPKNALKHLIAYGYAIVYEGKTGYTLEYNQEPTELHREVVRGLLGCVGQPNLWLPKDRP